MLEYVINRPMYSCNLRFSWRKSRKKWHGQVVAFKNLFVVNYFKHKDL